MERSKPSIILSTGKEVVFDIDKMSKREYTSLFDKSSSDDQSDAIVARVCGMTLDELQGLPLNAYRRVVIEFFKKVREPLVDPL
jgi:hypothetical protein